MSNPIPKVQESSVPVFLYPIKGSRKLNRPEKSPSANFFDLATSRHSSRGFAKLNPGDLDCLLWYSAKAYSINYQENGYILSHRASPSAGARHPIDILVCLDRNEPVLHVYNPFEHALAKLDCDRKIVVAFLQHINQNLAIKDGTLLWLIGHPHRTSAKYDHAESLIWRDAGALLQQIQLAATALSLTSCPIGTLGEPFDYQLFGSIGSVMAAGGIIVGNLDL